MVGDQVSQNWYKKTEAYLYNYKVWRGRLEVLQAEVALAIASMYPTGVASYREALDKLSRAGSPTEAAAIARLLGDISRVPNGKVMMDELLDLEQKTRTVEGALKALTAREFELVECHYFEGLRHNETADRLGMSRSAYFELRQEVVTKLARCMGFLTVAS